jgi:hypothetical protein
VQAASPVTPNRGTHDRSSAVRAHAIPPSRTRRAQRFADSLTEHSWHFPLTALMKKAVLDPETQPCYAADMPDTDSRPLTASLNDLDVMSFLHVMPLLGGAVAHRCTECYNEFGLAIDFCAASDTPETLLLSEFDRGRVEDSVIHALIAAPWLFKMHGLRTGAITAGPAIIPTCSTP